MTSDTYFLGVMWVYVKLQILDLQPREYSIISQVNDYVIGKKRGIATVYELRNSTLIAKSRNAMAKRF